MQVQSVVLWFTFVFVKSPNFLEMNITNDVLVSLLNFPETLIIYQTINLPNNVTVRSHKRLPRILPQGIILYYTVDTKTGLRVSSRGAFPESSKQISFLGTVKNRWGAFSGHM